jgi:hypothetical protein
MTARTSGLVRGDEFGDNEETGLPGPPLMCGPVSSSLSAPAGDQDPRPERDAFRVLGGGHVTAHPLARPPRPRRPLVALRPVRAHLVGPVRPAGLRRLRPHEAAALSAEKARTKK